MRYYYLNKLSQDETALLIKRPAIDLEKTLDIVKPILNNIKVKGLKAALDYAKQFDGFDSEEVLVTKKEFDEAEIKLDGRIKSALITAFNNIEKFHLKQFPEKYETETMAGINCCREFRAIENVGLYIPGGSAVLPSTMLMLGIPSKIAGNPRVIACSPSKNNKINLPLLFAAKLCGIEEFCKLGGAQAVGLMAYGDNNVLKVNKIFGPGNQYVTAAKLLVSIDPEGCSIDMPAGPSEVLVIADSTANPSFVAADLLSQAEHGADSQVVLITTTLGMANDIELELVNQLEQLPRKSIASKALENSFVLITEDIIKAIEFSNKYAPEHLIINVKEPENYVRNILNAGSVFLGQYSPESAGDYASGTNHSLPTYGYTKTYSGVSVESFMKSITFQNLTREGLTNISGTVETLAEVEGLLAHKNAVHIRLIK
jgi:histidinol dehydrogenase